MPHFHNVTIDATGGIIVEDGGTVLLDGTSATLTLKGGADIHMGESAVSSGTIFLHYNSLLQFYESSMLSMNSGTRFDLYGTQLVKGSTAAHIDLESAGFIDVLDGGQIKVRAGGTIWFDPSGSDADLSGNIRINGPAHIVSPSGALTVDSGQFIIVDGTISYVLGGKLHLDTGALTDIDDAVEFTYTGNRDKWKNIPLVPSGNTGWTFYDTWNPSLDKGWLDGDDEEAIVFEPELNAGISRVMAVVARVSGTLHQAGDPGSNPMILGVTIQDEDGTVIWSGMYTDTEAGASMDDARDLLLTVDQPIVSDGVTANRLIIALRSPITTAGSTKLLSLRVQYRYDHLDM